MSHRFEQLGVVGKLAIKSKVREIAFCDSTSMYPPPDKVKTKGRTEVVANKSTKPYPSYFDIEIVDD